MTNREKDSIIIEKIFGYTKKGDVDRPYWQQNGSNTCYTLGHDFYPSPTDDNRLLPFYSTILDGSLSILDWIRTKSKTVILWYNEEINYWFMEVDNLIIKDESLPSIIANHALIKLGYTKEQLNVKIIERDLIYDR